MYRVINTKKKKTKKFKWAGEDEGNATLNDKSVSNDVHHSLIPHSYFSDVFFPPIINSSFFFLRIHTTNPIVCTIIIVPEKFAKILNHAQCNQTVYSHGS